MSQNFDNITTSISGFYNPSGFYVPENKNSQSVEIWYGSGDGVWVLKYGDGIVGFSVVSTSEDSEAPIYNFVEGNNRLVVTATEPDVIYLQCVNGEFAGFRDTSINGYYYRTEGYMLP